MSLNNIKLIDRNECVGNSLSSINSNFAVLSGELIENIKVLQNIITQFQEISSFGVSKITSGKNISIQPTSGRGNVTVEATFPMGVGQEVLSAVNLGERGARVFKQKNNSRGLEFRRIVAGSINLAVTEDDNSIRITSLNKDGEPIGEVNTASNVGLGVGIYNRKNRFDLEFKTLSAGRGIELINSDSLSNPSILINSTVSASNIFSAPGSHGVFAPKSNGDSFAPFSFKSLRSGNNVTLNSTESEIFINATIPVTVASAGTGQSIFKEKVGDSLQFKTLKPADASIQLVSTLNEIEIKAIPTIPKIQAVGGGRYNIFSRTVNDTLEFKTLETDDTIKVIDSSNRLTLSVDKSKILTQDKFARAENLTPTSQFNILKEFNNNNFTMFFRDLSAGRGLMLRTGNNNNTIALSLSTSVFPQMSATNIKRLSAFNVLAETTSLSGWDYNQLNPRITMQFKALSAGQNIRLSENSGIITFDTKDVITGVVTSSSPANNNVYDKTINNQLVFKKIVGDSGINVRDSGAGELIISGSSTLPVGAIMAFAGNKPPDGWFECDGTAISNGINRDRNNVDSSKLFAVIKNLYGPAGTLPDLRGRFIRGWDSNPSSNSNDPNRVFGSVQQDAIQGHAHSFNAKKINLSEQRGTSSIGLGSNDSGSSSGTVSMELGNPTKSSGNHGEPRIANETRPKNVALLYCIKY
jgi:microcystin-dependent protein